MSVPPVRSLQRPPERLVLALGLVIGAVTAVLSLQELLLGPELDFHAYYVAGRAVLDGEPFVGWAITDGSFLTNKAYVYLPITAPLFAAYGAFSNWYVAYAIHTLLLLVTFYYVGKLVVEYIEANGRELAAADRWLILGFCLFSGPAVVGLYRGNIDPIILLLLAAGFVAIEQGRDATGGALWAVAAVFKLFPAFLGIWLLYRRSYRGIAAALGVGLGATLLSVLVFGVDVHIEFVEFILHERSREGAFLGGVAPTAEWITLRRPLSQVGFLTGHQLYILSAALLAPFLYLMYRNADSELDTLAVFTGTVVALLITVVPSTAGYVVYLLFPLVPLVYLVENRAAKSCFLAGLLLINLPVYPQHVERVLEALSVSASVVTTATDITATALNYGSVGLWAFLLVFAGCFICIHASDDRRRVPRGEPQ